MLPVAQAHPGVDVGGGCKGRAPHPPPPPRDYLRLSNTTGILGVEVKHETRLKNLCKTQ